MDEVVGQLRTELTADSTQYRNDLRKAGKQTGQFKKEVGGIQAALTGLKGVLAGALSAGLFVSLTKNALDFADAIGKSSDRIGISTSKLQELRFAFDRAGIGADELDSGLLVFEKRLGKARQGIGALEGGLKGGQEELLQTLKLTNSNSQALDVIFGAMSRATDQAQKLAIADAAFGTVGLKMTAAFNDAGDSFQESIRLGRELGIVLDEDLIRNAEKTNDKLSAVAQVMKIKIVSALLEMAPLIDRVSDGLLSIGRFLASTFGDAGVTISGAKAEIERLEGVLAKLIERRTDIESNRSGFLGFLDILDKAGVSRGITSVTQRIADMRDRLKELESASKAVINVTKPHGFNFPITEFEKAHKAISMEDKGLVYDLNEMQDKISKLIELDKSLQGSGAFQFGFSSDTNSQEFQEFNESIKVWREQVKNAQSTTKEAGEDIKEFFRGIGQTTEDSIVESVTTTKTALEGLRDFTASIINDIIRLIARKAIIEPIFNSGGLLSSLSKSIGLPGFAHGGSFTVGGGGGIDSQMVSFMATPGERVTVNTPGQSNGAPINVSVNMSTGLSQSIRAEVLTMLPGITEAVKGAVVSAQERNTLGGAFG